MTNEYPQKIETIKQQYNLPPTLIQATAITNEYNKTIRDPFLLYCIIVHSFNNQIWFNKKQEFNVPFWFNRSNFNNSIKNNLIKYLELIFKKI